MEASRSVVHGRLCASIAAVFRVPVMTRVWVGMWATFNQWLVISDRIAMSNIHGKWMQKNSKCIYSRRERARRRHSNTLHIVNIHDSQRLHFIHIHQIEEHVIRTFESFTITMTRPKCIYFILSFDFHRLILIAWHIRRTFSLEFFDGRQNDENDRTHAVSTDTALNPMRYYLI